MGVLAKSENRRGLVSAVLLLLLLVAVLCVNHQHHLSIVARPAAVPNNGLGVGVDVGVDVVSDLVSRILTTATVLKETTTREAAAATSDANVQDRLRWYPIFRKAAKRGLGGGIPGALAGAVQVLTLMWLRTIMNYQYRHGTSFRQSATLLFHDGGIPRFYRGLPFALVQAPLSRFISTAVNDGVEAFLASLEATRKWGPARTTVVASIVVGLWRMLLMPVDTCKTVLQVESVQGFRNLMSQVRAGKIGVLYHGAVANAASAVVSHYPWFTTYNLLSRSDLLGTLLPSNLLRNALIGLVASVVSDTTVNGFRVIKTFKQSLGARSRNVGYVEAVRMVVAADGWTGLFGRGLPTRLATNALQSVVFTVIWRGIADRYQT